jgi:N-acyl-D-aspartate/D-glutamate deacylase
MTSKHGTFDLVITGGRVIDPETGFDAVRNVGIRGGKIAAVTEQAIQGKETIDAKGHVVAPGFIDMHLARRTCILALRHPRIKMPIGSKQFRVVGISLGYDFTPPPRPSSTRPGNPTTSRR